MGAVLNSRLLLPLRTRRWAQYAIAVWVTLAVVGVRLALRPVLGIESPFLLVAFAVVVAGWFGGFGPSLLATFLAALALNYYFFEPVNSWMVGGRAEAIAIGLFLLEGLMIGALAEARLRSLNETERQRIELERANGAKDRFLAMLGHELRNPLAVISNATRLLSEPPSDRAPDAAERDFALAALGRQVATMRRLVDDLLDVARLSHGKLSLLRQPLDLVTLSQRVLDDARPSLEARQLRLTVDLPAHPVAYWGDATRLEQMLFNLLSNAEKYSNPGGTVSFRLSPAEGSGAHHLVEIRDDGIGMSPSMIERAFDLFYQDESAAARSRGGLGLGLSLVRRLAELHGGTVEASSPGAGLGTTVRVRLAASENRVS